MSVALINIALFFVFAALSPSSKIGLAARGKLIYSGLQNAYIYSADNEQKSVWPVEGDYDSSTAFLKTAFSHEWLSGMTPKVMGTDEHHLHSSSKPEVLQKQYNMWCVVAGLNSNTPPDTPCLFTRNVGFGLEKEAPITGTTLDQMTGLNKNQMPLQDKACVVVTFGGKVKVLACESAVQTNFNPTGSSLSILAP